MRGIAIITLIFAGILAGAHDDPGEPLGPSFYLIKLFGFLSLLTALALLPREE
jgi:hypothetical protein